MSTALGAFVDRCAAIIQAFMPGCEGGVALARVISGAVNPSGHLPTNVPRSPGGQPGTYLAPLLGRDSGGVSNLDPTPLFPFGHGLSYTRFSYDSISLSSETCAVDEAIRATVRVRNTGPVAGETVVQLYLTDVVAQVIRPVRALVGFARLALEPGAAADVVFDLHAERTCFTGLSGDRIIEPGAFTLTAGGSSEDLPLAATFTIAAIGPVTVPLPVLITPIEVTPL